MRMKVTLQNLHPDITNKTHTSVKLETNNIGLAVNYAIKREFGIDAEIGKYEIEESKHHHCDLFAVVDVNYRTYGTEDFIINVNGKDEIHKKPATVRITSKVRVEILKEKIQIGPIKNFLRNLSFSVKAKKEFKS